VALPKYGKRTFHTRSLSLHFRRMEGGQGKRMVKHAFAVGNPFGATVPCYYDITLPTNEDEAGEGARCGSLISSGAKSGHIDCAFIILEQKFAPRPLFRFVRTMLPVAIRPSRSRRWY